MSKLTRKIHNLLQSIDSHKSQHKFFQDFAEYPIPFIEEFIQSQIKDGEVRILLAQCSFYVACWLAK